jgi:hypothetical protein
MQVLKRGSRGSLVVKMKQRLRRHGLWKRVWPLNQGFGRITEDQVRKFQARSGLTVDGQVGPQTWAALNAAPVRGERARAVAWALGKVGVVEQPAGSNKGPGKDGISAMQNASIGFDGQPWCQCMASYSAQVGTRGRLKAAWYGGYTVSVVNMARNGQRGLAIVSLKDARPGDWVFFNFNPGGDPVEHVGIFLSYDKANGTVTCVEGNTSSGSGGSQDNGGGCFKRTRSASLVPAVVRVPFHN